MPARTSLEKVKEAFIKNGWEITSEEESEAQVVDRNHVDRVNYGGRVRQYGKKTVPTIQIAAFNGSEDRPGMHTRLWGEFELATGNFVRGGYDKPRSFAPFTYSGLLTSIVEHSLPAYEDRQEVYRERHRARIAEEAPRVRAEYERMKLEEAKEVVGVLDILEAEVRNIVDPHRSQGGLPDVQERIRGAARTILERLDKSGAVDGWAQARGRRVAAGRGTFFGDHSTSHARFGRWENGEPVDEG